MGYFESFYAQKIGKDGKRDYVLRTLDSDQVESYEAIDESHTKVFMRSGDTIILRIHLRDFSQIITENSDVYGRILVFSDN